MTFLLHLLLIAGGLIWFVWLLMAPAQATIVTASLVCGYLGSNEGFLGTVIGLVFGAFGGWAIVGLLRGFSRVGRLLRGKPRARLSPRKYTEIGASLQTRGVSRWAWQNEWFKEVDAAERKYAEALRNLDDTDEQWEQRVEAHNRASEAANGVFLPPPYPKR